MSRSRLFQQRGGTFFLALTLNSVPDIFSTSPPNWLVEIARPIDTKLTGQVLGSAIAGGLMAAETVGAKADEIERKTGERPSWLAQTGSWFGEFLPAAHEAKLNLQDPLWKLKAQKVQLGIMGDALGIVSEQQKIDTNKSKIALMAKDTQDIPAWLREHPTVESRMSAEWPAAMTPEWNSNLNNLRLRDSQSVQAKVIVSGVKTFADRLSALAKEDSVAAAQIAGASGQYTSRGQMPPPAILEALSVAEQASQQRKENERTAAVAAAEAAGQVPETRITDKGITTVYRPSSSTSTFQPREITLASGTRLIQTSPNQYRIAPVKGTERVLTDSQLLQLATQLQKVGDAKSMASADQIQEFLAKKAEAQISTPASTATATPSADARVKVRGKDGKLFTVPKAQLQQAIDEGYTPLE